MVWTMVNKVVYKVSHISLGSEADNTFIDMVWCKCSSQEIAFFGF